jgi:hypothetical protein
MSRCLWFAIAISAASQAAAEPVSFTRDVAPILVANCEGCHGARAAKGGYRLLTFEDLLKPGDSESPPLVAGKPAESFLFSLITATDESRMPKEGDPLTPTQMDLIKRWIEEGARFDGLDKSAPLASIIPPRPQPDPPLAYRRPIPITALAFKPGGDELAASGYHEVTIWNPKDGALLRRIKNVPERVHGIAFTPDGNLLAVSGGQPGVNGEVKLYNTADGSLNKTLLTTSDVCFRLAISPDGKKLAVACADHAVRIYDIATGSLDRVIDAHADWVISVAWSPDGKKIASGSRDHTARIFDVAEGELMASFLQHPEPINTVAFLPEGKSVGSGAQEKRLRRWFADDGKQQSIVDFAQEVLELLVSGDKVFTACADGALYQHRGSNYQAYRTYAGCGSPAFALAYDPMADRLAAGSLSGEIRIFQAEQVQEVLKFTAAPGYLPASP